jgi:hypothetical protein
MWERAQPAAVVGFHVGAGVARDGAVEGARTGWIAAAPVAANGRSHRPSGSMRPRSRPTAAPTDHRVSCGSGRSPRRCGRWCLDRVDYGGPGRGQWPLPQAIGFHVGAGVARDGAVEGARTGWIAAAPVAANGRSHRPSGSMRPRSRPMAAPTDHRISCGSGRSPRLSGRGCQDWVDCLGPGRGQRPLLQTIGFHAGAVAARAGAVEGAWTGWIASAPVAANGRSHRPSGFMWERAQPATKGMVGAEAGMVCSNIGRGQWPLPQTIGFHVGAGAARERSDGLARRGGCRQARASSHAHMGKVAADNTMP